MASPGSPPTPAETAARRRVFETIMRPQSMQLTYPSWPAEPVEVLTYPQWSGDHSVESVDELTYPQWSEDDDICPSELDDGICPSQLTYPQWSETGVSTDPDPDPIPDPDPELSG